MAITDLLGIKGDTSPETQDTPESRTKDYQKKIDLADPYFKKHLRDRADRMVQLYELNHYYDPTLGGTPEADFDRIKVPYPYANARQILAETFMKNPEAIVKPTKKSYTLNQGADPAAGVIGMPIEIDTIKGAEKMKKSLHYVTQKSALKKSGKWMVLDSIVTGVGAIEISGQKKTKMPKYTRCTYKELLWSPEVYDPYQSPWIVRKLLRPLDAVKKDETLNKEMRMKVKANARLDSKGMGQEMSEYFKEFNYVLLFDVWDKENNVHMQFPDKQTDVILIDENMKDKYNFSIEDDDFESDFPFTILVNEEMLSKSWGLGDMYPLESSVKELDKTRTQQVNHRKRFNRKYLFKKGFLDEAGKEQFKNPEDGTMVEAARSISDQEFQVVQDAPMSADIYRVEDTIRNDIQIISPLGPDSLVSGVGGGPQTLGQSQIVEQNSDTRLDEKRDNIANAYSRLFRLTAQFIQQYWVETDEFLIDGDGTNDADWLNFNPEEIQGEYVYETDPETLRDNTPVFRKQVAESIAIAQPILGPAYPQGMFVLLKKYFETFKWSQVEEIVPAKLTEPPVLDNPLAKQILSDIQNLGVDGFLAKVQTLPDNEKQAITEIVNKIMANGGVPTPGSAPTPNQNMPAPQPGLNPSVPSLPNMTGAANNVKQ